MDINYLLHRHQISLMRAKAAVTAEARLAHRALASGYAAQIGVFEALNGSTGLVRVDAR